jgi:5'-deoxynucleotidase YfbR-like HD superfamily hydrolase
VRALVESLISPARGFYSNLDVELVRIIAEHHDDPEIQPFLGDVPLQLKLMMNGKEKKALRVKEILAAEAMARVYPKRVGGYNYLDVLFHAIYKDCREAQLVSVADKCDGYCEALHELLAGNVVFAEPIINYHTKTFNNFRRNYPLIGKIFSTNHSLLSTPVSTLAQFFDNGRRRAKPHDLETIARETGDPRYELWKKTTIELFGVGPLINQVEFFSEETLRP